MGAWLPRLHAAVDTTMDDVDMKREAAAAFDRNGGFGMKVKDSLHWGLYAILVREVADYARTLGQHGECRSLLRKAPGGDHEAACSTVHGHHAIQIPYRGDAHLEGLPLLALHESLLASLGEHQVHALAMECHSLQAGMYSYSMSNILDNN